MGILAMVSVAVASATVSAVGVILFYRRKGESSKHPLHVIEQFFSNQNNRNLTLRVPDQGMEGLDRMSQSINGFIAYMDSIIALIQIRAKQTEENAEALYKLIDD
ncbi:MAG: hypothetical protein LBD93_10700, partial [Treponema sp.]|nr:hypothetical protein [Treponema sp.]